MEDLLEDVQDAVSDKISESFHRVIKAFDEMGYPKRLRERQIRRLTEFIEESIDTRVREFIQRQEDTMVEEVEKLGHEFLTLRTDLGYEVSNPDDSLSMGELREYLVEKNQMLGKVRDERLALYEMLKKEGENLSLMLHEEPKGLRFNVAPSEDQLNEYKEFIKSKRTELAKHQKHLN